jgi:hypothetical protein
VLAVAVVVVRWAAAQQGLHLELEDLVAVVVGLRELVELQTQAVAVLVELVAQLATLRRVLVDRVL